MNKIFYTLCSLAIAAPSIASAVDQNSEDTVSSDIMSAKIVEFVNKYEDAIFASGLQLINVAVDVDRFASVKTDELSEEIRSILETPTVTVEASVEDETPDPSVSEMSVLLNTELELKFIASK